MIEIYSPRTLSKKRLDQLLSQGWFRSCNSLFRPQIIFLDNLLSDIVHVRLKLKDYTLGKRQLKRFNKIHSNFTVRTGTLNINDEKEALYNMHKAKFKGFIFHSLEQVVYDQRPNGLFDTQEITVHDGDELIAFSFFDKGEKAMASIISVYKPEYDKLSLGTFTMMQEILEAQELGMDYYYPGYIFDNNAAFDYKIRKQNMQYLNETTGRWNRFRRLKREETTSYLIEQKIERIHEKVKDVGVDLNKRYYPLNSLGYLSFEPNYFLKGAYILIGQISLEEFVTIEYLHEQDAYLLSKAQINNTYLHMFESEGNSEDYDPLICFDNVLEYQQILSATNDEDETVTNFKKSFFV